MVRHTNTPTSWCLPAVGHREVSTQLHIPPHFAEEIPPPVMVEVLQQLAHLSTFQQQPQATAGAHQGASRKQPAQCKIYKCHDLYDATRKRLLVFTTTTSVNYDYDIANSTVAETVSTCGAFCYTVYVYWMCWLRYDSGYGMSFRTTV